MKPALLYLKFSPELWKDERLADIMENRVTIHGSCAVGLKIP